jgi:chemotaxis protein CheX
MDIDSGMLTGITAEVWASMLEIELVPAGESASFAASERTITACVQITGGWKAAVTLRCATALAAEFAGVMFGCEADSLSDEEVRDALGELSNMVSGSVKGMSPEDCQLGIPTVADGMDYSLTVPKGKVLCTADLAYEGRPIEVVVYEQA